MIKKTIKNNTKNNDAKLINNKNNFNLKNNIKIKLMKK
tara:strand:- start:159 stop:272 length:114 start_codon:yes stop_codon:yes gene_type:complete